ncbi:hypothetical protein [Bythopirellula polymerisocia]|uniref:Uncharacterized protein n=1 Tax=Bythopirellula polymerisocia TaxID=2528003 RepID=A0A5C6CXZ2_9BACT|nr:hypothetical protein [Bythopirellula polymerisocia]TWU29482.1 hypothetical protein Pla144_02600 [Bythopirellula polymerisocia]
MWKVVATLASMVVCGAVTLFVTALVLMELGSQHHNNKDYYGSHPALVLGPAVLGFLVPWALVWLLDKFVNQEAWKVGLLVFVSLVLCLAIRVSLG